jgi:hypothetical protein
MDGTVHNAEEIRTPGLRRRGMKEGCRIDKILEWPGPGAEIRSKPFWESANRCLRRT